MNLETHSDPPPKPPDAKAKERAAKKFYQICSELALERLRSNRLKKAEVAARRSAGLFRDGLIPEKDVKEMLLVATALNGVVNDAGEDQVKHALKKGIAAGLADPPLDMNADEPHEPEPDPDAPFVEE